MSITRRRFPRVPYAKPGEIDVTRQHETVAVTVREVSPGGLGLTLSRRAESQLPRNTPIAIRFRANDEDIELPGRVAWYGSSSEYPLDMGVQLQLHLAPQRHRRIYARWVVDLLTSGQLRPQ